MEKDPQLHIPLKVHQHQAPYAINGCGNPTTARARPVGRRNVAFRIENMNGYERIQIVSAWLEGDHLSFVLIFHNHTGPDLVTDPFRIQGRKDH